MKTAMLALAALAAVAFSAPASQMFDGGKAQAAQKKKKATKVYGYRSDPRDGPRPGCYARSVGQPHLRTGQPTTPAQARAWCNR